MFSRFFKPRWQHTDAKVREQAVTTLDPDSESDRSTLAILARGDSSAAVRAAASAQLIDLTVLDHVVRNDKEQSVRDSANQRIEALLAGTAKPGLADAQRLQIIGSTDNQALLAAVAHTAKDSASRLTAASRIDDESLLMQLALQGADAELRISVAGRLQDPENLRRLTRDGRDKKVIQLARERLKFYQQQQQEYQQHAQRGEELIELLLSHSKRPYDNLYAARLQQLQHSWEEIFHHLEEPAKTHGAALIRQCQQHVDEWQQQQQKQQAEDNARLELKAAINTLQDSLQALHEATEWPASNSLAAILASQQRRWQEATDISSADPSQEQHYLELVASWKSLIDHWRLLDQQNPESLWPENIPVPPELRKKPVEQEEPNEPQPTASANGKKSANEVDRTIGVLHNALRQRQLKFANRLWHKLEQLQDGVSTAQRARMEKLKPQLDELRDWHAFAAEPKKLQLCEQMERLAKIDMAAQEKADSIQILQEQWRELMSADQQSDQALWDRFRAAADMAWEPCREHFAEQDRERAANLAKRVALCDQLEQYLATLNPENVTDWSAVAEIRRAAPQEWKSYHPVRFTDIREVSKRFSDLLKRFDDLLDNIASTHIAELEKLIEEGQSLLNSDDSRQSAEHFKNLQKRWQNVGWVPLNSQRKLYKRFRTLADQVFARREEQFQAQREQASSEAEALRCELQALQHALNQASDDNAMKLLADMVERINTLPCPKREEKLQQQRESLVSDARQRRQRWPQWQRWSALKASIENAPVSEDHTSQQELAVALEVIAGLESPEHAREQRMQWQLQQLSSAMKSSSGTPTIERCREILEQSAALEQGLSDGIRQRILKVWAALEPKL
ncbi:DUF349 domain-containing protein [Alcanivorax sp. 1008]|uniref:DUF349 domain-containing protein n=1 Tax=Alcanivorax sp. 1008 TaxID=2816853 RepID=UPI001D3A4611|nr:DUF349 domain-containing protein [Alcanivorax sp. 1008]MCC1497687.1 DUF349 domain-containing protein [Alcanivorax sp. 1008]